MQKFMTYIVNLMKKEKLFASQGGPIILSQVENEYGNYEAFYGDEGKAYAMWCANMAVSQNTGVPWIMCQQYDAPYPVIDTCNGFYCDQFTPNPPKKPKMWTENWTGWFKNFGSAEPHRPAEDIAFGVARFFQKGGSLQNYYMYHGGTNFGRTAGSFLTTSYDYDAPIDEFGLARQPKWGHLKELHKAIKLCEAALLNGYSTSLSLGPKQEADVFKDSSGACAAFLANVDDQNDAEVKFGDMTYQLPAWSVSILPDCKNVVFNTAKVGSQSSIIEMVAENIQPSSPSPNEDLEAASWEVFVEKIGLWAEADMNKTGLVDQINTTKDTTDYLWYTTSLYVDENEGFLKNGSQPMLSVESLGHVLHVFVNEKFQGTGNAFPLEVPISLKAGTNEIALLSMTVGLPSAGPRYEWVGAGPTSAKINGLGNGTVDLSLFTWKYKIGLQGEKLKIYNPDGNWVPTPQPPKGQPLTWYKAVIDASPGDEPIALDMMHMGKGLAWLNGEEIGRYWPINASAEGCVDQCDYRGAFKADKCSTGCGKQTQRWYHVPRSWFKPSGNVLVILEELGGDPTQITFSRRKASTICASVSEDHPFPDVESWEIATTEDKGLIKATARLSCPSNTRISAVKFASFGNPAGTCGSFSKGDCHDPNSASIIEKNCLNRSKCAVELSMDEFDPELCPGSIRRLVVEALCSS